MISVSVLYTAKEGRAMHETPGYVRQYVEVTVDFTPEGLMLPRALVWEDGRRYEIDRVRAVQAAPALKAGGQGDRYTVSVAGRLTYLFFERSAALTGNVLGRWFVERRTG